MLVREANPEHRCSLPGCPVTGDVPATCVAWGNRMCVPHFAAYWTWSEHLVRDRAPTPYEWTLFLAWNAAQEKQAATAATQAEGTGAR